MSLEACPGRDFCSQIARDIHEEMIGTASAYAGYLLVEVPLPWAFDAFGSPGAPPVPVAALTAAKIRPLAVAPDHEYARPGLARVWYLSRPEGPAAAYAHREYLVPVGQVGALAEAVLSGPAALAGFEPFRQPVDGVRDLLMCTHGSHDACCGKFGYPIYQRLRDHYAPASGGKLRIWRVSHIGGHRFAPTLLDLPSGRCWGHLTPELLEPLVLAASRPDELLGSCYRGWGLLDSPAAQVAEREAFLREGWDWLSFAVAAELQGDQCRLAFTGARSGAYTITVAPAGSVETVAECGGLVKSFPKYRAVDVNRE